MTSWLQDHPKDRMTKPSRKVYAQLNLCQQNFTIVLYQDPSQVASSRRMQKPPNWCPYSKHLTLKYYVFKIWIKIKGPYARGLPWWLSGKESTCQCMRQGFDLQVRKFTWRSKWQPNILAWEGKKKEAGGLQSMGLQGVGHDSATIQQPPLTPGHSLVTGPLGRQSQRQIQISQYGRAKGQRATRTWDILSRCLASSLSLAFWKWACSFSSPGVSRYLSTASGVLAAVVGTITQKERRFKESDRTSSHFKRKPYFRIIPEQRIQ